MLFHEESLSSAERTQLAGVANSLTGQALPATFKKTNKMKFTALILITCILNFQKAQEIKLEGKYKMEYETEFAVNNCTIEIHGLDYKKKLENGRKVKGKIEVQKKKFSNLYILKDHDSDLEVDIVGKTYRVSDTIFFRTKNSSQKDDENDMVIYSGKLIRIK